MRISGFQAPLFRVAGSVTSSVGRGGRGLLILIYHRVLSSPDPLRRATVQSQQFEAQMDLLASCFNVLPLGEAVERMRVNSLPRRAVAVTFDDGYADNLTVGLPIMIKRGIRPTVFIASSYLDGGLMFNDAVTEGIRVAPELFDLRDLGLGQFELLDDAARRSAIGRLIRDLKYRPMAERQGLASEILARASPAFARNLMLTTTQVRKLRDGGAEIGAHTATHPILARLEPDSARADIAEGREVLEGILGERLRLFAYPNGRPVYDYDSRHVEMVRELGFTAALTTAWGTAHADCDLCQLPRVAPWDTTMPRFAGRLVRGYTQRRPEVTSR